MLAYEMLVVIPLTTVDFRASTLTNGRTCKCRIELQRRRTAEHNVYVLEKVGASASMERRTEGVRMKIYLLPLRIVHATGDRTAFRADDESGCEVSGGIPGGETRWMHRSLNALSRMRRVNDEFHVSVSVNMTGSPKSMCDFNAE